MTLKDVGARLNVSYATAHALVTGGKLRAFRAGTTGTWRVDEDDLEQFIESRKTVSQPSAAGFDPNAQFDTTGNPFA